MSNRDILEAEETVVDAPVAEAVVDAPVEESVNLSGQDSTNAGEL